ncbi:hypothetical protein L7F22_001301 [Adiantum nelumboides]|nr:hypothetical protein [Adiantum nelumboides]
MGNPNLQGEVQQQLHAYGILPPIQQERGPERFQGETSKRGLSTKKGMENPYQELKQLLEGKPSSKKKGHAQHERSPSREREESESSDESMEDVAPRRRRAQRSPTPTKRKRSPHSPHHRESKREEKNSKKKKERKRSPSSPSSSPSSSLGEGSGYSSQERRRRGHQRSYAAWKRSSKLKKFKEGGKNISFLTYDSTFGATDKVLTFIQQFDAAFGDEGFMESSKLRHVAMHFQKSARQWWASLRANGEAPKTWKALRTSIMKQFLASDAKDKVLTKWRSLKLSPYESIHKYVDKFWHLHLKATVYKKIDFEEQKQQFCAGLPEDMNEYVNSQRPRSISAVIHHTMVAARINFQQGAKRNLKPMEAKEKQEYKRKNFSQDSSKGNSNNNKAKEKGVFKAKNKLTPKDLERYRKENKCFKCGEQGHSYRSCPQRNPCNEQPRASMIEAPKEEVHCKGSPLSYAWGKVREHEAFILFEFGSTHNFISLELATKLGVQDFEMGDAMKTNGAFINQEVSVTPLIGKLRLHIQRNHGGRRQQNNYASTSRNVDDSKRLFVMQNMMNTMSANASKCDNNDEIGDDTAHPIAHTENVPLSLQNGNVKYLADVLHVPNITRNLVSIEQMVEKGLQGVREEEEGDDRNEERGWRRGGSGGEKSDRGEGGGVGAKGGRGGEGVVEEKRAIEEEGMVEEQRVVEEERLEVALMVDRMAKEDGTSGGAKPA